jgi:hypothetical protein
MTEEVRTIGHLDRASAQPQGGHKEKKGEEDDERDASRGRHLLWQVDCDREFKRFHERKNGREK